MDDPREDRILDYRRPDLPAHGDPPDRGWLLSVFVVVAFGFIIVISSPSSLSWRPDRRSWPLPIDISFLVLLLLAAFVMAAATRIAGWKIGLFGGLGAYFSFASRIMFKLESSERNFTDLFYGPLDIVIFLARRGGIIFMVWVFCRSIPDFLRPAPNPRETSVRNTAVEFTERAPDGDKSADQ